VSIEWFIGAKTNVAYNALDRHVEAGKGDTVRPPASASTVSCPTQCIDQMVLETQPPHKHVNLLMFDNKLMILGGG